MRTLRPGHTAGAIMSVSPVEDRRALPDGV